MKPRFEAGVATGEPEAKTLGEEAYARLRADVIAGRLLPGQRLPVRHLSQTYGIGIGPLREALSRMASDRLVQFDGNRGYAVSPVSLAEMRDLCALRIDLSCKALRAAISRGDDAWEASIIAALHRLERCALPESPPEGAVFDTWEQRHDAFHQSLLAACGSPWLIHFVNVLSEQFQRYRRCIIVQMSLSNTLLTEIRHQHRRIAEATIARDADQAVQLLAEHFEGSIGFFADKYADLERIDA